MRARSPCLLRLHEYFIGAAAAQRNRSAALRKRARLGCEHAPLQWSARYR
jgi:hypothetical protein